MVKTRSASHIVSHDSSVADSNSERMASRAGDHPDEEDSDPEPAARRVKRARKRPMKSADNPEPPKKPKRRRGRLDLMPTMNLDILFHILSFCYPMDLLNLSRTTKDFRNLLLQPSSATAWKTARLQVEGLPDCPSDMSEPQYANLAFYPHCHGCDRVVRNVSWALRVRYCSECFASNTVDEYDQSLRDRVRCTSFRFYLYLPSVSLRERGRRKSLFLKKALDELLLEHSKMPEDQKVAFLDKKRKYAGDVMRHAEQCLLWMESVASSRKHELDDLRCDRTNVIITRLTEAGYKPELDYMGISWLQRKEKAAFRAKSLTTKEWDRIRPDLTKRLDSVRVARLEGKVYGPRREILMTEYKKYLQQPPPPGAAFDVMPHATNIAEFNPFRDIIMSPESTTITASSFVSAFQQLPGFVPSWRAKIDREFIDQICFPKNYSDSEKQNDLVLQLATAVFAVRCGNDRRLHTYPEVLLWPGFRVPWGYDSDLHDWVDTSVVLMEPFGRWTWSASRRCLLPNTISVFEGTAAVVRSAGFDPKTACPQDMERLDARFACGACSSPGRKVVMNWEMAILHSYRMHQTLQEGIEWTLIEGDELTNVKNYEHETEHSLSDSAIVYCALCQHHIGDAQSLRCTRDHLATIHGIDKAERGTHYIPDRNSISVIAMVLDSDGKVSNHVNEYQIGSFSSGVEILRQHSHSVYP